MAEKAAADQAAGFINEGTIRMDQKGNGGAVLFFQVKDGLLQYGDLFGLPEVILVAEEYIIRVTLTKQGKKVSGCTQVTALLAAEKKAAVTFRDAAEQGRGFICGTVVLHQDGKIRISLRSQRFQQGRQMSAAIVRGQQNGSLYHVIPHFRKYLKTETIWRMRPLKVRVFSRAHLWVTHISGW